GNWVIDQNLTTTTTGQYMSRTDIVFKPNKEKVCCKNISFTQFARPIDDGPAYSIVHITSTSSERMSPIGYFVDREEGALSPWYGYGNDGRPTASIERGSSPDPLKPAKLKDDPFWTVRNRRSEFLTCAVCKEGKDLHLLYDC